MSKASRDADRTRKRLAVERDTARADQPVRKSVPVPTGYPFAGWRDEVWDLEERVRKARSRQATLIAQALLAGCTYSEVARVLGISRQAAYQRFRHIRPTPVRNAVDAVMESV